MFKYKLILGAVLFVLSGQSMAGGGGGGGATEATQIMNNGELLASVSKQSQLVAGQIRDYAQQVQQYMTMVQNLKNMPANVISETLGPYKDTLRDLGNIYKATTDVYETSTEGYNVMQRRIDEMKSLSMNPEQYMNAEFLLAKAKGGIYKAQLDSDLKALENAQKKAEKLSSMGEEIGRIEGNVHGLALLAQHSNVQAGELMEMNNQIRQTRMEASQVNKVNEDVQAERVKQQEALKKLRDKQTLDEMQSLRVDDEKWTYMEDRKRMLEKFGSGNGK